MFYYYRKLFWRIYSLCFYPFFFKEFGRKSFIISPDVLSGGKYISIGDAVRIRSNARIEALDVKRKPSLRIANNVNIEQSCHIICSGKIHIGSDSSIAPYVVIVDTSHPIDRLSSSNFSGSLNEKLQEVIIGDHCFIGAHSIIQPNVRLGNFCVVASNSVVVSGEYQDGSVLAGSPAKVIKTIVF